MDDYKKKFAMALAEAGAIFLTEALS